MRNVATPALAGLMLALSVTPAHGIPAFARKYRTTCAMCHSPVPRLNAMGEQFASNGFELVPGEQPTDTIDTGDPLLRLKRDLPLAVRIDAYLQGLTKRRGNEVQSDLQVPWVVKLLSGGQLARKVSYYLYFLASERGDVGGLEDAYIQFTDVGSSRVNLLVGQFQVSDPLFKRELRLHYEDYQLYRVRVGEALADLTYDRGLMATWSPRTGTDLSAQVVNGRGLSSASSSRQFDTDPFRNFSLRVSQDVGPARIGGFGYIGRERSEGFGNSIRVFGPDATIPLGSKGELNVQYLRRTDSNPFFGSCSVAEPCPGGATSSFNTTIDAAMAEVVLWPRGPMGRLFFTGLVNWIDSDYPVISLRLGEQDESPGYLERYRMTSIGVHYLLRRNVRLLGETGWDFDLDRARIVTGFNLAF